MLRLSLRGARCESWVALAHFTISQTPGASTMQGLRRLAGRRCGSLEVWEGEGRAPRMCASAKRQYCESVWLLQPSHWLFCCHAPARVTPADSAPGHMVAQGSPPQLSSGRSGPRAGKQT